MSWGEWGGSRKRTQLQAGEGEQELTLMTTQTGERLTQRNKSKNKGHKNRLAKRRLENQVKNTKGQKQGQNQKRYKKQKS